MRASISHWTLFVAALFAAVVSSGCQRGGYGSTSWLPWGKKDKSAYASNSGPQKPSSTFAPGAVNSAGVASNPGYGNASYGNSGYGQDSYGQPAYGGGSHNAGGYASHDSGAHSSGGTYGRSGSYGASGSYAGHGGYGGHGAEAGQTGYGASSGSGYATVNPSGSSCPNCAVGDCAVHSGSPSGGHSPYGGPYGSDQSYSADRRYGTSAGASAGSSWSPEKGAGGYGSGSSYTPPATGQSHSYGSPNAGYDSQSGGGYGSSATNSPYENSSPADSYRGSALPTGNSNPYGVPESVSRREGGFSPGSVGGSSQASYSTQTADTRAAAGATSYPSTSAGGSYSSYDNGYSSGGGYSGAPYGGSGSKSYSGY